jgi:hypothetical protein
MAGEKITGSHGAKPTQVVLESSEDHGAAVAKESEMKGTIVKCLQELVVNRFGKENWHEICELSGFDKRTEIPIILNVSDAVASELLANTCSVLNLSFEAAADAFGDYWCNEYAPKIYASIYRNFKNAREFILGMDRVHLFLTQTLDNANPPRFDYEAVGDDKLLVTYKSQRNLVDVFVGLARGLGRYFDEDLRVTKLGQDKVEIVFG